MNEQPRVRLPGSTVWTAIFTGVLTLVAMFQLFAYMKANDLNVSAQRATMNAGGPGFAPNLAPDGKSVTGWKFQYGWTNSGHLPAKNLLTQFNMYLGDKQPQKGLDFSELPQSSTIQSVIGPGSAFAMPESEVSIDDLKAVSLGQKHLFFWGWMVYEDGLSGKKRLTEFCNDVTSLQFSNPNNPTDPKTNIIAQWPPCQTHNCYDDECEDYAARTQQ
jgi:hypothetical protein